MKRAAAELVAPQPCFMIPQAMTGGIGDERVWATEREGDRRVSSMSVRGATAMTETVDMIHEDGLPGKESTLQPKPEWQPRYPGSSRLADKIAIVTGADSGSGRAVAALFAREGADVVIAYLCEHGDAEETAEIVREKGRRALTF